MLKKDEQAIHIMPRVQYFSIHSSLTNLKTGKTSSHIYISIL